MNTETNRSGEANPWAGKNGRYHVIAAVVLLSYVAFAAYDTTGFYGGYMNRCREQPESAECKPLNPAPKVRRLDPALTLDYGRGKLAIEVGSNMGEAEANNLVARLQASGIPSRVVKILRRKQALYQVQIGRFLTQKNANEVGAQLQAEGFISRFSVVAYK
ncbi:MAG: hypothetical protein QOE77_2740 [Blastocatellia bacterium]|jgi:hypothetical protein|nr:hypothetical protein [Blastocatellia bacterium]